MRRAWLLLVGAFSAASCEKSARTIEPAPTNVAAHDAAADTELTVELYTAWMQAVTDDLVGAFERWSRAEYATQAEAMEAMLDLVPANPEVRSRAYAALQEYGVTVRELATFMEQHPEAVDRAASEMQARLVGEAMNAAERRLESLESLPEGDLEAVARRFEARLRASQPLFRPPTSATSPLPAWTRVATVDELAADTARAGERPLIIHIRAEWAAASQDLEESVFADPRVSERLADYHRVYIDVTHVTDDDHQLQTVLNSSHLPSVSMWRSAAPVAEALAAERRVPAADAHVSQPMTSADQFLAAMP